MKQENVQEWGRDELDVWFGQVHLELRKLAASQKSGKPLAPGTTSLVHLAYERLARTESFEVREPSHFFALAAKAMRHVLVDHARACLAHKRGAGSPHEPFEELSFLLGGRFSTSRELELLLDLERALESLTQLDPELARLVEHHIHLGVTLAEYAELTGTSLSTVKRRWRLVRARMSTMLDAISPTDGSDRGPRQDANDP